MKDEMRSIEEALKLALEALETAWTYDEDNADGYYFEAITALREALAEQPAQCAPAADGVCESLDCPNHRPAQRTWVGLTDEEITDIWAEASPYYHEDDFAKAIEAKLKEKNT